VGKTYLVAEFIKSILGSRRLVVAAPTHKACRVLRSKLSLAGIRWAFKPEKDKLPALDVVIVDTTAALLGVRPVITEEQTADEVKFAASAAGGSLPDYLTDGGVLLIDEVSMVGADDFYVLKVQAEGHGSKIIAIGDEGQLPPVKKVAIDFAKDFDRAYTLSEVVRQAAGSAIITLAWAIRNEEEGFEAIEGFGLIREENVVEAYLAQLELPVDDESQRSVFIGYTNATVNAVQERACRQVYGHSAKSFKAGELVLATRAGYEEVYGTYTNKYTGRQMKSRFAKMVPVVANADQLRVLSFNEERRHPTFGVPVTLDRVDLPSDSPDKVFESYYLSAAEISNPEHPFNVEKVRLGEVAKKLQSEFSDLRSAARPDRDRLTLVDQNRKNAWGAFFAHDQRIISFAHCWAITSHKSQGSTYRSVYVSTGELLRYNKRALYVATTRPSKELHW
jgi:hypothetical protein